MPEAQILVVEDEGIVAEDIRRQLKSLGYSVPAVASSGEEAIRKVFENKPDLVLMDILLKGEMDGIQATERINSAFSIPVVYLTAHSEEGLLQRAKQTEPFGYILKPFAERELYSTIETALYKHKADEVRKVLARQQAAVTVLRQRALQGVDLSELMKLAVTQIAETLRVEYSSVWELLPEGKKLLLRAGSGGEEMLIGQATVSNEPHTEAGFTLLSDAPVIIEDFRTERRFSVPSLVYAAEPISGMNVVIHGYERLFGVLAVHATSSRVFGTDDANFLQAIANVLGIALERRRSEDALWEAHNELERRVEQRTVELVRANAFLKKEIHERKRAEEALGASEERYRALFENAKDPIYVHDLNGIYRSVNPAAEKLSGYARDEILGKHFSGFVAPEYVEQLNASLHKKRQGDLTRTAYEVELIAKDGRRVPVEVNSSLIYENGQVVGVQGMARDLTERKRRQEELRRSEEQYRELVENINDILYATNDQGVITYISQAIEYSTGLSPSEIIGHPFAEFIHPEDLPSMIESFQQSASGLARPIEFRIFDQSGKTHWLRKSSRPVFHGNRFAGTRGLLTDVTERKRTGEALRSTNQMLQTLIHSSPLAIAVQNREGKISLWNPAAEQMLGWTEAEILGRSNPIVPKGKEAKFEALRQKVLLGRTVTGLEKIRHRKDGSPIYLSSAIAPLIGTDGGSIGTVIIMTDITESKRVEEALKQSERDYRELFEQAHDAILIIIPESEIVLDVNRRACEMYGFSRSEFIGMSLETISKDPSSERLRVKETLEKGDYLNFETVQYRKDGAEMFLEINAAVINYKNQRAILSVNRDVSERKLVEEERAQLLRRLVTAQEEERRRLSRELHDQMGQSIALLLLGLKSLDNSSQFQSPTRDRLHQLQGLTNQLARDVHQLASSLRPTALDDLGLHTALSNYVQEWSERSKIPADFHGNGLIKERLPGAVETTVYRIVQESLTNVLKHAHARNVSIIVEYRGNRVLAIVEDDGRGFDTEAMLNRPMSERHLGLLGMKERVALVGGRLNIESTLNAGTTVLVHIPISPRLAEENPLEETTHSLGR